jgi:hypothetical protein
MEPSKRICVAISSLQQFSGEGVSRPDKELIQSLKKSLVGSHLRGFFFAHVDAHQDQALGLSFGGCFGAVTPGPRSFATLAKPAPERFAIPRGLEAEDRRWG